MARTTLFARLRRLGALCRAARSEGMTTPEEIVAWVGQNSTRRAFTQRAALGSVAVAIAGCSGESSGDEGADSTGGGGDGARVAIIGGGMAGLHCAYRLREVGVDATVYESSDRTGGRMYSARGMFADDMVAELGGELIDSIHQTLFDLADEFGIQIDDREASYAATTKRDTWFVGGVSVPDDVILMQFAAIVGTIADQSAMADADDATFAMLDGMSLADWLDTTVPPSMYPELNTILSTAYRGEYGLENDQQSALNLIYFIGSDSADEFRIFGDSDERFHTHLGNDTFTTVLADALEGHISTGMALTAARDGADGGFVLVFDGPDGEVEVEADHVVFALPFTRLRQVDLAALTLGDEKRQIIDELGYGTNAKVMGGFTQRVWRTDHDASGSVTSDLPSQQFWDTSVGQTGDSGLLTNFLGGQQGLESLNGTPDEWYLQVALPDLEVIWPGTQAAYVPGSAVRMHWPSHPHTLGSYAGYRVGQWAFYGLEGVREGNVHFCGEHTSLDFQGFMEGAAETGMLVAMAILGDLGITASQMHRQMVERKLVLPHPAIHGRLPERPRWGDRQRALVRPAAQVLARRAARSGG